MSHNGSAPRIEVTGIAVALLVLGLTSGIGAGGAAGTAPATAPAALSVALDTAHLTLTPAAVQVAVGAQANLSATWAGIPAGCQSGPIGFRWQLLAGPVGGTLASPAGSTTRFWADSTTPGLAEVKVRSGTVLECGLTETAVNRTAVARVTVVAPPWVGSVQMSPDPVAAGTSSELSGIVAEGSAPYRLRVDWGDGSVSTATLAAPGAFSLPHVFAAGNFTPTLELVDAAGRRANVSVEEPVYSSSVLAVGIAASSFAAEVGVPINFTGEIEDLPSAFQVYTSCSNTAAPGRVGTPATQAEMNFSCTFDHAGAGHVGYAVVPFAPALSPAEANLTLPVAPALGVSASSAMLSGEAGHSVLLPLTIEGGVAPFSVGWNLSGSAAGPRTTVYSDGPLELPAVPAAPGPFGATVRVEDALGQVAATSSFAGMAAPPLNATARATSGETGGGVDVTVWGR